MRKKPAKKRTQGRRHAPNTSGGWPANLLLLIVSVVFALGVLEIAVRASQRFLRRSRIPVESMVHDTLLGWHKRPNASIRRWTSEYDHFESFNSRGLRGEIVPFAKPDGEVRVAVLGDSFAEGYSVALPYVLSEQLRRRLASAGARVEVINFGTAGYSTDQELLSYTSQARLYAPDVVVLLFYMNDVWYNTQGRYWRGAKPWFSWTGADGLQLNGVPVPVPVSTTAQREVVSSQGLVLSLKIRLNEHSRLYAAVRERLLASPAALSLARRLGVAEENPEPDMEMRVWAVDPGDEIAEAWSTTGHLLARLHTEVTLDGGRLVIMHVPNVSLFDPNRWERFLARFNLDSTEWQSDGDERGLKALCDEHGLECVFPSDQFRAATDALGGDGEPLYYEQDAHWTRAGHALAADILARYLESPR